MEGRLKLGTRGSPLALAQARKVASALETAQRTTTTSRQPAVAAENHTENRTQEPPETDTTGPL